MDPIKAASVAIITAALGWLYGDVLLNLAGDWWNDPNNSHGLLIPFICLFLVHERWERLRHLTVAPAHVAGGALLTMGLLAMVAGNIGAELFVQRSSLVVVVMGLILFNLGWQQSRLLSFPVLFFMLAIPVPSILLNAISFPLQLFAARCAEAVLYLLSIPVFREGNVVHLAHTTLEVAEACSGIRSLVSLITLALIFAYFSEKKMLPRAILALSAIPIAVVTNAGRVAGTGILAQLFGEGAAQGFYHMFSGWLVFVAAFALLLAEGALIRAIGKRLSERFQGGGRAA